MICQECGKPGADMVKHIPRPQGMNGWVELVEEEMLCPSCVRAKSETYELLYQTYKGEKENVSRDQKPD